MIKFFCDCCGKEIIPEILPVLDRDIMEFPPKRVRIEPHSNVCGVTEEFLVGFLVTAYIYKPKDLMDKISESEFIGHSICAECIVERLIQRG